MRSLEASGCDAALLYDPLDVRDATDTTDMSIWTMHNPVRFAFVATDGPLELFAFSHGKFISVHSLDPTRSISLESFVERRDCGEGVELD
ncbi:MAG: hypothetical protein ABIP17_16990 [Ilumatobacteraceae bacterium]